MTEQSAVTLTQPVTDRDHIQGSAAAQITVVEYGDFECPHCAAAYPIVEALRKQEGERLRFVFRHFPLTEAHPNAQIAAEAAEAAGAQDRFWEMHELLFENQNALAAHDLAAYAGQLGIDTTRFKQALAARTFKKRVREDFMSGVRSGVNGTPTFFVNGVRYDGPPSLASLTEAVAEGGGSSNRRDRVHRNR
jgi:protein-disulfide isomerase